MLKTLRIQNFVLIDSLELNCDRGFTAITGETGAGKSILLGALSLVLGKRADLKSLRNADQKCILEAEFEVSDEQIKWIQKGFEFELQNPLIIRREIYPNGKTRAFVNDSVILLNELQELCSHIISIFQQFDYLEILQPEVQFALYDSFVQPKWVDEYGVKYKEWKSLEVQLNQIKNELASTSKEFDFLQYQLKELNELNLKESELSSLENEIELASKSQDIISSSEQYSDFLNRDGGILEQLHEMVQKLKGISVTESIEQIADRIQNTLTELKESERDLTKISLAVDFDAESLQYSNERLLAIHKQLKKHRVNTDTELLQIQTDLEKKISLFNQSDETQKQIELQIEKICEELVLLAKKISTERKKHLSKFDQTIQTGLVELGMPNARFQTKITETKSLTKFGMDELQFLFSANKGVELGELKNQASGGELSRLNLLIYSTVAQVKELPIMLFDEIDTGVSGQVALKMGELLRKLSTGGQVFSITHSAQVASKADSQYLVYKETVDETTYTRLKRLNKDERIVELAKILSGDPPSKAAVQNAKDLLSNP
ncbi:MAG TPA: DNA repair protein RecN [Saprospiraceae bacterium]|nr:DNA repair protein RecN [Saprospiraceae bacterium]